MDQRPLGTAGRSNQASGAAASGNPPGLGADGLWCVGRSFARFLERYRSLLAGADREREHDTDGRGPRTQAGLDRWCAYVLETMLDQV